MVHYTFWVLRAISSKTFTLCSPKDDLRGHSKTYLRSECLEGVFFYFNVFGTAKIFGKV